MSLDSFLQSVERRAFKLAVLATRNEADAFDLVQDSMLKLVNSYSENESAEWPLLFQRILQNCIRDWHRANVRKNRLYWLKGDSSAGCDMERGAGEHWESTIKDGRAETPHGLLACEQDIERIQNAIEALPYRQQQSFLLRSWEGYSVEDTASAMQCSKSSVKTHHARALKALRRALENDDEHIEKTGS